MWHKSWKILWKKTVVDAWTFASNTFGRSGIYNLWTRYYDITDFWLVGFNWLGHLSTLWLLIPHFTVSLVALFICFTLSQMEKLEGIHPRKGKMLVERQRASVFKVSETHLLTIKKNLFLLLSDSYWTAREWNKIGNLELVWRRSKLRHL